MILLRENRNAVRNRFILYPLRGLVIALVPFIIHLLTSNYFIAMSEDLVGMPIYAFYLFSLFITLLIYNSFALYFATYDREQLDSFIEEENGKTLSFFGERRRVLTTLPFYLELFSALFFTSLLFFLVGFRDIDFFIIQIPVSRALARCIGFFSFAFYLFILMLDRRCEARKYWGQLFEKNEIKRLNSRLRMAVRGLLIVFLYPIATPLLPMLLYFIINVVTILLALANMLTIIGLLIAFAAVIAFFILIARYRFYRTTKKIEKQILDAAGKFGYTLRLFMKDERILYNCNGYLEKEKKRFYFKIMSSPSRFTPLYFLKEDAYYLHKFGTKNHFRSFERHVKYAFDAEGQKSIILPKITNYIFVKEDGSVRRLYEGDSFFHYTIYHPKSYLGNLERECIGRSNQD